VRPCTLLAQGLIQATPSAASPRLQGCGQGPALGVWSSRKQVSPLQPMPKQARPSRRRIGPSRAAPTEIQATRHPAGMESALCRPPGMPPPASGCVIRSSGVAANEPRERPSAIQARSHCPGSSGKNGASQGQWRSAQGGQTSRWHVALRPAGSRRGKASRSARRLGRLSGWSRRPHQHDQHSGVARVADWPRLDWLRPRLGPFFAVLTRTGFLPSGGLSHAVHRRRLEQFHWTAEQ